MLFSFSMEGVLYVTLFISLVWWRRPVSPNLDLRDPHTVHRELGGTKNTDQLGFHQDRAGKHWHWLIRVPFGKPPADHTGSWWLWSYYLNSKRTLSGRGGGVNQGPQMKNSLDSLCCFKCISFIHEQRKKRFIKTKHISIINIQLWYHFTFSRSSLGVVQWCSGTVVWTVASHLWN